MKRVLAIINPVSGKGKGSALIPQIEKYLDDHGWECEIQATKAAGHASELAAEAKIEDYTVLLAVGGDGTINEVIAGSRPQSHDLAIMPLGTGNVLAKELKLSGKPMEALKRLVTGNKRKIDIARLSDGRYFASMLSAGVEGEIIRSLKEARAGGSMKMSQYLPLGFAALGKANYRIRIFRNRELWHADQRYVVCANTHSFGGPIEIVSQAKVDDGALNLLACDLDMRFAYPALVSAGLVKSVSRIARVVETKAQSFRFESADEREVPFQLDGEYGGILPVEGEIIAGGLTIYADQPGVD